ncbi:MAG: universal stress protein [Calditrichia bacterium]
MQPNKILVPIDFSEFSSHALNYAIGLAEKFQSKLTLLHAVVLLFYEAFLQQMPFSNIYRDTPST